MKKRLLTCAGLCVLGFLVLGFIFVRWANNPENVAALKEQRKVDAAKKAEDELQKAEMTAQYSAWKSALKLAFDENFADNQFHFLRSPLSPKAKSYSVEEHKFKFNTFLTKGEGTYDYRILSHEEFENFAAELTFSIWGDHGRAGITWSAGKNSDGDPKYQDAYSNTSYLYVNSDEGGHVSLGGFLTAVNEQVIRVEKFGRILKISVNGKPVHEEFLESSHQGPLGIILGQVGGVDTTASVSVTVKSLKVWK